mgnify:CR=1 FL=1
MGFFRFLKSLRTLARNGDITIDEAYKFAKQEFGEVSDLLKLQINKIFKDADAPSIKLPKKEGEVIDVSFKPGKDKYGKVVEKSPSQESGIMDRVLGAAEKLRKLQAERDAMYKPKQGLDMAEGLTRTIARRILDRKKIQIGKRDPIDVFTDIFGESINDVNNLAEEMIEIDQRGGGMKDIDEMIKIEGLYDIDIPQNPQRGMTDEELEKFLKDNDPDRNNNAMGGINRVNFRKGGIKLVGFLARKGKDLKDEITRAINNFMQRSGDNKLDADLILDDMLEELGTDRDKIDQKDVIDAYGQIYDNLTADTATAEFLRPSKKIDLPEGVDPRDTILPSKEFSVEEGLDDLDNLNLGSKQGDIVSKQLKVMRIAEDIEPGLFEKLNDTQLDIIVKYGDMIDDKLLKNIVLDPDPNNQAAALATIEEAKIMLGKGMSVDEVLQAQGEALKRKKNAEGGLNYLMGF